MITAKQPIEASRFVLRTEFSRLLHRRCSSFLGHCRAATHGDPQDNRNNHPHVGQRYALVHNGIITNVEDLQDRYSLELQSQCDSEVILRLIETQADPLNGLSLALRAVRGSMAVALYDQQADSVWLASNGGRSLWLAHLPQLRIWVIASTDGIITSAVERTFGKSSLGQIDYLAPVADHVPLMLTSAGSVYAPARRG